MRETLPAEGLHPDDATLAAWSRCDLPPERAAGVEAHLEVCEGCAARLESLSAPADDFVQRLREAAGVTLPAASQAPLADENLLFGALALQAGFVTPQQLADACLLWSSRGGAPLADILAEQGALDEEARASIASLLAARASRRAKRPAAETLSGRATAEVVFGETASDHGTHGDRLRLKQLHSQGGIGQVWRAFDTQLGREVALKELLPELRGSRRHRERFFREARVGAQLSHPGTAPVYEYREEGGRCFYTMKFYSGRTFSQVIRATHAASADAAGPSEWLFPLLEQFLSVCDTIAYAHSRGILHRDLKGENIVLGEFGEVTVIDWGLAKAIPGRAGAVSLSRDPANATPTLDGERLGTPGYMAPEQARGDLLALDERTDVYGLAAVMYELLTTRSPFAGATANEVMHRVEVEPPRPPRETHPDTPEELEAICLRGLSKRREDRQQSAAELRDELRGWLSRSLHRRREAERQAKFFSLSQDLFVALDDRGVIQQVNPAYANHFGFDPSRSVGKHHSANVHPDDLPIAKRMFEGVQRGVSQKDTVVRIASADGAYRSVSWSATRVPGEPLIFAVGRPLDEASRRRRLADERARFFALSHDLCVGIDHRGHATQVNPAWVEFFGVPEERAVGQDVLLLIHPDERERVRQELQRVARGDSTQDLVTRQRRASGEYALTSWTLTRVAGEDSLVAIGRPLDAEAERRRELEDRARFFALSPDLFVISDDVGLAAQVNDAWRTHLGWEPEEVVGNRFHDFVHPDDVAPATLAARQALVRGSITGLEVRMRRKAGGYQTFAWTLTRVLGRRINFAVGRAVTPR